MSFSYFNKLNYTLANEDTTLEVELLPERVDSVLCVAGSGGRALPLLSKYPKKLTCVDLATEQLWLTELRIESARAFTHSEYLSFFGFPPEPAFPEDRKRLFEKVKPSLSEGARKFFQGVFEENGWESLLYDGKWEQTFRKLSKVVRKVVRAKGLKLFQFENQEEYYHYLFSKFPQNAWKTVLFFLGNATIFNSLLYRGHFPKKSFQGSMFQFYFDAFSRLLSQGPARKNFFLQLCFLGEIVYPEGNPIECDPEVFRKVKEALSTTQVEYVKGSVVEVAEKAEEAFDFFSFSDVPSYFSGDLEKKFMQKIKKGISKNGKVVVRNYIHEPQGTDLTGWENIKNQFGPSISKEKMQMYTVDVFKKQENA